MISFSDSQWTAVLCSHQVRPENQAQSPVMADEEHCLRFQHEFQLTGNPYLKKLGKAGFREQWYVSQQITTHIPARMEQPSSYKPQPNCM